MDFDLVLDEIGEFGRYQKTNYTLICLPVLFAAANSLSYVFTAGIPDYRYISLVTPFPGQRRINYDSNLGA